NRPNSPDWQHFGAPNGFRGAEGLRGRPAARWPPRAGRPSCAGSALRGGRHEVDELLDTTQECGLEVAVAAHATEDVLPGPRDVGLLGMRPAERLAHAVLPLGAARDDRPRVAA